jgi:hypothetical protein
MSGQHKKLLTTRKKTGGKNRNDFPVFAIKRRLGKKHTHWINTFMLMLYFARNFLLRKYYFGLIFPPNFQGGFFATNTALKIKRVLFCAYMSFLNFKQTLVECSTVFNPAGLHKEPDTKRCCFMLKKITGKHKTYLEAAII